MRSPDQARGPIISVELLLDADTETEVRGEWDSLAGLGVSSLAAHTAPSNRPHVTLLVRSALEPFDASALIEQLPIPVTLAAPILFGAGDRRILARSVVPSEPLLRLHATLHACVPAGEDAAPTRPGQWTPYVTLARRIRLADLPAALAVVGDDLHGQAVGMRRWDAASATVTPLV